MLRKEKFVDAGPVKTGSIQQVLSTQHSALSTQHFFMWGIAMVADKSRVIVSVGGAAMGGSRVHHQDFPEIRSDGPSPSDAAIHLSHQLTRALDSALTKWRRDSIEQAIADVKAFAADPK